MVNVFVYVHKSLAARGWMTANLHVAGLPLVWREMGTCLLPLNQTSLIEPPCCSTHKHSHFRWLTRGETPLWPRPPPVIAIKMCSVIARVPGTTEGLTGLLLALMGKHTSQADTLASILSAALNHRNSLTWRWKANRKTGSRGTFSTASSPTFCCFKLRFKWDVWEQTGVSLQRVFTIKSARISCPRPSHLHLPQQVDSKQT